MSTSLVASTHQLRHYYGQEETKKIVLKDISFSLHAGEIVILTGPSGSGKSTLLTILGCLRTLQEGAASILGFPLADLSLTELSKLRAQIGFIFQSHNLFPSLTACQNVQMAGELFPTPNRIIQKKSIQILERLGLEHRINHKPAELSGGQRQRVAIARALVNKPRLILADEPTAALDRAASGEVVKLFRQLVQSGERAILMVTHDEKMYALADRVIHMEEGEILVR
ncbi:ABC transporter, ATP binding protein [Prochlorococcus marinus str. MIT 9313]|uniref:ABC transporter, ATP binding protein n=1 Tax=Prochlorococcus marinus (strain MIT 9313) TaxID=74547 RepID=Q7V5I4_PROMM|nr:ABC transporter ATP-binding protein [Prochlorococcus marinus]CAE21751.1 ABC transporter, ATP binding protein [Prochlorococcus marinus str. MIT 9313]